MSIDKKRLRMIENKLKEPFNPVDVEWRVQKQGTKSGKPYAMVLAYVQSRAIMDRLDEVMTPFGWQNEFTELQDGSMYCRIGLRLGDEWIWKGDGAGKTNIEAVKGGFIAASCRNRVPSRPYPAVGNIGCNAKDPVIPAQAGIQSPRQLMDPRLRGDDAI